MRVWSVERGCCVRVLIADDALMNRRLLRRAFTCYFGQGWSVTEATSAEEAVLLATETAFEVIVMDEIFAPGVEAMRGSAAIIDVRAHEARAGVARRAVIVSCTGNVSSLTNLDASGADLVWGKPMPNFTNGEIPQIDIFERGPPPQTGARATRPASPMLVWCSMTLSSRGMALSHAVRVCSASHLPTHNREPYDTRLSDTMVAHPSASS